MEFSLLWTAVFAFIVINALLVSASLLVYAERKVSAFIQNRPGPNRVGPLGLLTPFADVFKFVMKEDIRTEGSNPWIHAMAPVAMVVIAMTAASVIPFARGVVVADVNVGVLVLLAITSVTVYGITLAGWSSNSKYSLLGGLRSAAQMISYELSMGLAIASVVLLAGTFNLTGIVEAQSPVWYVFLNPLGFIIFVITAFAETNRAPFDLPEAEQELVGGFHTEYSGMKFGMFFLAEYVNWFVASFVIVTLFFGGYLIPFESQLLTVFPALEGTVLLGILQFVSLMLKVFFFVFLFIWVRWTFPRFKYNQLMDLGWKYLLPLSLANVIVLALIIAFYHAIF